MSLECDACEEPARRLDSIGVAGDPTRTELDVRACVNHDGYAKAYHAAVDDRGRAEAKEQWSESLTKPKAVADGERMLSQDAEFRSRPLSWRERHPDDGREGPRR